MTERKFDQFTDLSHLLSATANIVIADVCKITLLVFSLYGVSLYKMAVTW